MCVEHVVGWFFELSGQRRGGFAGAEPIAWSEIADWASLTGREVLLEEVEMLIAMDAAFRGQCREEQKAKQAPQGEAEGGKSAAGVARKAPSRKQSKR